MDKYRRYKIETPRTGGGSVLGFLAVIGVTLGALAVCAADAPPRLAHTVFIEPAAVPAPTIAGASPPPREAPVPTIPESRDDASSQEVALACSFAVCAETYRSFRASDCTFQPYEGPRRMCTR
jgi:hypothetical protein